MPRLLVFAMCQKSITDSADASLSLISLMYGLQVSSQAEPLQPDAVIPLEWSVASSWLKLPDDEGKTFEQRVQIVKPDGTTVGEAVTPFKVVQRSHQNTVKGSAFPVGQVGEYKVQLWLREVAEGKEWEFVTDYPFEVTHAAESPNNEQ